VTVFDGTRSSAASIIVFVQASEIPLVRITSSPEGKVNPANQIVIIGSTTLKAAGTFVYSLNDTSIDIVASSLSSVAERLPAGLSVVTLTMGANTLAAGSTLAFTLSSTSTVSFILFSITVLHSFYHTEFFCSFI
jgi:hypothetical protein